MTAATMTIAVHTTNLATTILAALGVGLALLALMWQAWSFREGLRAEEQLHRAHLAFQRGEADRTDLRGTLDALAEHIYGIRGAARRLIVTAETLTQPEAKTAGEDKEYEAWVRQRLKHRAERLQREIDEVDDQVQRLTLRLGSEGHPLVRGADLASMRAQSVVFYSTLEPFDLEKAKTETDKVVEYCDRFLKDVLPLTKAQLHIEAPATTAVSVTEWPVVDGLFGARMTPPGSGLAVPNAAGRDALSL